MTKETGPIDGSSDPGIREELEKAYRHYEAGGSVIIPAATGFSSLPSPSVKYPDVRQMLDEVFAEHEKKEKTAKARHRERLEQFIIEPQAGRAVRHSRGGKVVHRKKSGPSKGATGYREVDLQYCPEIHKLKKHLRSADAAIDDLLRREDEKIPGQSTLAKKKRLRKRYSEWEKAAPP